MSLSMKTFLFMYESVYLLLKKGRLLVYTGFFMYFTVTVPDK